MRWVAERCVDVLLCESVGAEVNFKGEENWGKLCKASKATNALAGEVKGTTRYSLRLFRNC